jgi:anti-sigma factor RsiW
MKGEAVNDGGEAHLTRYLLGESTEDEKTRVEEQFFADDAFFEALLEAETELVDQYADGTLDPAQRTAFEERIARSPALARRVEIARALRRRADGESAETPEAAAPRSNWVPLLLAACLVLASGLVWMWQDAARLRAAARQFQASRDALSARVAEVERGAAAQATKLDELSRRLAAEAGGAQPGPPPRVLSFLLKEGLTRGSGDGNAVRIAKGAGVVQLEVPLRSPVAGGCVVRIETPEGRTVARFDGVAPDGTSLRVALPASVLQNGDYVLTATSPAPRNTVLAEIAFRVVR